MNAPFLTESKIIHPVKHLVTLQTMRNFSPQDYLLQRKLDGCLSKHTVAGIEVLCEWMKRKSGGFYTAQDEAMFARFPNGWRAAFTVAAVHGENMLTRTTRERWGILCSFEQQFPSDVVLCRMVSVPDKLTDEEGYVAHAWGDSWGNMLAVKQASIYECKVTAIGATQSVEVKVLATGATCRVTLAGGKCDLVRVGSIIRVECLNVTDAGKLYQPRPCREWLKQF